MSKQRITIIVQPRPNCDTRRALQSALKYMGRLGLACVGVRDGQPTTTPPAGETREAPARSQQ